MSSVKKAVLITAAAILFSLAAIPAAALSALSVTPTPVAILEAGELADYSHISNMTAEQNGNYVTYRATGSDPYIHLSYMPSLSDSDSHILIKYRTSQVSQGQLYFMSAEPCVFVSWNGSGEWSTATVDGSAAGSCWLSRSVIRIDPFYHGGSEAGMSIDIEYAAFFSSAADAAAYAEAVTVIEDSTITYSMNNRQTYYRVTGSTSTQSSICIPSVHEGLPVQEIRANAFTSNTGLRAIYIPSSVVTISSSAFTSGSELTIYGEAGSAAQTFAANYGFAFFSPSAQSDFSFTYDSAYNITITGYNGSDTAIVIPPFINGMRTRHIARNAFVGCAASSVHIPVCTLTVGETAFLASGIGSVYLPNTLTSIGTAAFKDCARLSTVDIPGSVTSISNFAFMNCTSLSSVKLGDGVVSVGRRAFGSCPIRQIMLPASLTELEQYAFMYCSYLTSIEVDSENTQYSSSGGLLYSNAGTQLVSCPEGVSGSVTVAATTASVGRGAFFSCDNVTAVELGTSLTSISDRAFYACPSLQSMTVGKKVVSIGVDAFTGCTSINVSCYIDTEALAYCRDNSVPYTIIAENIIPGDVNDDSVVNGKDVIRVRKYIADSTVTLIFPAADVNEDGIIDNDDVILIKNLIIS